MYPANYRACTLGISGVHKVVKWCTEPFKFKFTLELGLIYKPYP